jgi:hypothetical protein
VTVIGGDFNMVASGRTVAWFERATATARVGRCGRLICSAIHWALIMCWRQAVLGRCRFARNWGRITLASLRRSRFPSALSSPHECIVMGICRQVFEPVFGDQHLVFEFD